MPTPIPDSSTDREAVFFYEAFAEEADAIRRHLPDDLDAGFDWRTIQEAEHAEPPARVISIRTQSAIPPAWADKLAGILTRSTGYDHIRDYRRETGVCVPAGYLPDYCTRAVAEQAALLWMALLRRLPAQLEQFDTFHRDGLTGTECAGRTLLVVGVGRIGREVVRIGEGLGMRVLGVDIDRKHDDVEYVSIDKGLPLGDVIVCAMNLTDENVGYFDRARLSRATPGLVFVNVTRGELAPTVDLLTLLDAGHLGGIGLDVYECEKDLAVALRAGRAPPEAVAVAATLELSRRENVILTPHNAFNTAEAVERKAAQSVESIIRFSLDGTFPNPVPE